MISNTDTSNMKKAIYDFPDHMEKGIHIGRSISLNCEYRNIHNIVIAGMGGSAIGGDIIRALMGNELNIPFFVSRNYSVPHWVNEKTLVICSSYSGNTEETLSAFNDARRKHAQICGITTGGKLLEELEDAHYNSIIIPGGLQPRAALGISFVPVLYLLSQIGVITTSFESDLESSISSLRTHREIFSVKSEDNPAFKLAMDIFQTIPVIYGQTEWMNIAGIRFRGQLNENGKMLAFTNELPEMNHNEIVGWENNTDIMSRLSVIWLLDESDHPRVKLRQNITQNVLKNTPAFQKEIRGIGKSPLERFIYMVHFSDWVSYWCAYNHKTDPTPVQKIDALKNALADQK